LGAPSSLLQATRRAVADETRHAKLCFALATQYGGRAVGPGSLNMTGALNDLSIETILRTTIVEGCVGETQAALEASRASNLCKDPVVARVFATIAADESRHAELAWRFVGWLLREYPEQSQLFHATLAQLRPAASDLRRAEQVQEEPGTTELGRLGMLSSAAQARVRRETWAQVIEPCARALGDQHSTAKFHGDLLVQNASEPGPSGHFQVS
jgi:rubrerythrin